MITTIIVLLAGALPLKMAAMSLSELKIFPGKELTKQLSHSFNDEEQAPMLPEGGTLRVQRKRGKVSSSERDQSTK